MLGITDTHAHLADSCYDLGSADFCGTSVADIISAMPQNNLQRIISVGYNVHSSAGSKVIAQNNKNVFFAPGIHPSESLVTINQHINQIYDLAKPTIIGKNAAEKCVAIGEIGLDYHYDNTDKPSQKKILLAQLEIAKSLQLPVIFHVRDASADMMQIVKQNLHMLPKRGVMHCFSGSLPDALEYIKMGFYISFSGSLTFKNAVNLTAIPPNIPRDRVLVETDCPYLAPTPYRGKTNLPQYVAVTADKLAELWQVNLKTAAEITSANAENLFKF